MKIILASLLTLSLVGCATLSDAGKPLVLDHGDASKIGDAVRNENVETLKNIFSKIPSDPARRNSNDQQILNDAMALASSKGEQCDVPVMNYLESIGGMNNFYVINNDTNRTNHDYPLYKIPMCKDYMIRSHQKFINSKAPGVFKSQADFERKVELNYVQTSYQYTIDFFNMTDFEDVASLQKGLDAYKQIITLSVKYGKEFCRKDGSSEGCVAFGYFRKLPKEVLEKKKIDPKLKAHALLKNFSKEIEQLVKIL